jgi:hypothetical protein
VLEAGLRVVVYFLDPQFALFLGMLGHSVWLVVLV